MENEAWWMNIPADGWHNTKEEQPKEGQPALTMGIDDEYYCTNPAGLDDIVKPDDFCSYGERNGGQAPQKEDT